MFGVQQRPLISKLGWRRPRDFPAFCDFIVLPEGKRMENIIIAIITGMLLFMAFDLKVFVRSFNCENCACCAGNPRESFAKVGYFESPSLFTLQLVKGYHLLPPAARGPAGEWYRTIGSSQASEGEPNTMVCRWYCLTLLSEVSRNKLQMQQPSFQK